MYFSAQKNIALGSFQEICQTPTRLSDYPNAEEVVKNIVIYDGDQLRKKLSDRIALLDEVHQALKDGPGVIVIRKFYSPDLMDQGTKIFNQIITEEKKQSENRGDHFAKGSPNARIWNVVEKLLATNPEYFYDYFKNPLLSLIAEAWLGPAYQMTAQVNLVRPGSAAQTAHRDYHLGFLDDEVISRYPVTAQVMSQYLTLQGAAAHSDMPLESGPTMFLPHSQKYELGYMAMRRPDFIEYFNKHAVQNELHKGDAAFFSPALFHAAGENRSSNHDRMGNLFQISSSFGKPMEKVNLLRTSEEIYPLLLKKIQALPSPEITEEMEAVIRIIASGYPFPSNLDIMKPKKGSLTPASDQDVLRNSLLAGTSVEEFRKLLRENQV